MENHGQKQESPKRENGGYEMVNVDCDDLTLKKSTSTTKMSELIEASKSRNLIKLKQCLERGDKINEIGPHQGTALYWAADSSNYDDAYYCCDLIIQYAKNSLNDKEYFEFLNKEDILNQTALFIATERGNYKLMELLLCNQIKLGFNYAHESLFHVTAKIEPVETSVQCTKLLLDEKWYDNSRTKLLDYLNSERKNNKRTPLHFAAIAGNQEVIKCFIRNGADPKKTDNKGQTVMHLTVHNSFERKSYDSTKALIESLNEEWKDITDELMHTFELSGKAPIHIAARRGFSKVLGLLMKSYAVSEGNTGYTALHSSASLGNPKKADGCVREILKYLNNYISKEDSKSFIDSQDNNGCTALYLSAQNRNIEACKQLLLANAGFDIKSKRGKTSLEKVYEKIPQAVNILLDEAIKNSGYVSYHGSINTYAELDFGPILGYNTTTENIYKETETLSKITHAKFEDRKEILRHPFIKIYIYKKWEKIRWFFTFFRVLHILWFLCNFFFLVSIYRVHCPFENAKRFSWTSLRPIENDNSTTKSISECNIPQKFHVFGWINLLALFIYSLSQIHQTKASCERHLWSMKPTDPGKGVLVRFGKCMVHSIKVLYNIFPWWPIFLSLLILVSTVPVLGVLVFDEMCHYIFAGILGLSIWLAIYLEFGKIPRFRVYINLLMRSTKSLLWAIVVTAPILIGFDTVFVVLMPGEASFSSALQSFVKVITFMIGELDYEGLFYGEDVKENVFSGFVMLALAVFVVVIVLLLVNYLIGLAAEEIRDFGERAEIWKLCTQIEQIVLLESFLDDQLTWCGREFLRTNLMLMPPERENDGKIVKQRRTAFIKILELPQNLQKELHELDLETLREEN